MTDWQQERLRHNSRHITLDLEIAVLAVLLYEW